MPFQAIFRRRHRGNPAPDYLAAVDAAAAIPAPDADNPYTDDDAASSVTPPSAPDYLAKVDAAAAIPAPDADDPYTDDAAASSVTPPSAPDYLAAVDAAAAAIPAPDADDPYSDDAAASSVTPPSAVCHPRPIVHCDLAGRCGGPDANDLPRICRWTLMLLAVSCGLCCLHSLLARPLPNVPEDS